MHTEALLSQLELLKVWEGESGLQWSAFMHPIMMRAGAAPSIPAIRQMMVHELNAATPYFIDSQICDFIATAQSSLPDVPLLEELLPEHFGFVYLQRSFPLNPVSEVEKSSFGNPPQLKAFSWGIEYTAYPKETNRPLQSGVGITAYEEGEPVVSPLEIIDWDYGHGCKANDWKGFVVNDDDKCEEVVVQARSEMIRRYILTLFSFMSQELLAVSTQRVNRAARRQYERMHEQQPPLVKVVVLRKKHYVSSGLPVRDVKWSCRWVVRGHWRNQWYPGKQSHKAIWINPFVKGPEDKGLKRPSITLFEVKR